MIARKSGHGRGGAAATPIVTGGRGQYGVFGHNRVRPGPIPVLADDERFQTG